MSWDALRLTYAVVGVVVGLAAARETFLRYLKDFAHEGEVGIEEQGLGAAMAVCVGVLAGLLWLLGAVALAVFWVFFRPLVATWKQDPPAPPQRSDNSPRPNYPDPGIHTERWRP